MLNAVDYVEDRKGEARDAAIDTALGTMKNKGMETGSKDIGGVIWKWFIPTKSCLKRMSEEALGGFPEACGGTHGGGLCGGFIQTLRNAPGVKAGWM